MVSLIKKLVSVKDCDSLWTATADSSEASMGILCREAEIQENLGQRVWLSEQVTVEKLNVELAVTWMTLVVVTS